MSLAQHIKLKTLAKNQKNGGPVVRARGNLSPTLNGNGKAEKVGELLEPYLPLAIRAWVDGLKAEVVGYDRIKKITINTGFPDHKIRADCALRIVEYVVGRAIERSMQVTGNYKELNDLVAELKASPEAQRLIAGGFFDQLLRQDSEPEGQKPSVETQSSE